MTVSPMATKPRRATATLHTRTLAPLKILAPNLRRGRRACQHTLWHRRAALASPAARGKGLQRTARSATHLRQHLAAHALRLGGNDQAVRDHLGLLWASHRSQPTHFNDISLIWQLISPHNHGERSSLDDVRAKHTPSWRAALARQRGRLLRERPQLETGHLLNDTQLKGFQCPPRAKVALHHPVFPLHRHSGDQEAVGRQLAGKMQHVVVLGPHHLGAVRFLEESAALAMSAAERAKGCLLVYY